MSERALEERLLDAVLPTAVDIGRAAELRLAISTALTLARREGYVKAMSQSLSAVHVVDCRDATYPLPTRTVRKLREEPDPETAGMLWRWNEAECLPEYRMCGSRGWNTRHHGALPTTGRVAVWYSLMQRPYHEEEQAVDPNEVLPP